MIQYPVSPTTRWAVLQVSTGKIIARNKQWPVADGSEIPGLDPDFVYLLHVEQAAPDHDSRFYVLGGTETVDADANELRRSWEVIKRPAEELKVVAENAEIDELRKHISLEREVIETRLVVSAILQYIDGLALPPKVETMTEAYKAKGVTLWKNRDRLKAILAEIDSGTDPDIDTGWEPTA